MYIKIFIKKLLQSIFGLENYLLIFLKYLLFTSSHLTRFIPYYERKFSDLHYLLTFLKVGDVCIDVGANIGFYSIKIANAVGISGHVYSFEPVSINYNILVRGTKGNLANNITYEKLVISDKIDQMTMLLPASHGVFLHGFSHVVEKTGAEEGVKEVVSSTTLDTYFRNNTQKIRLLKIDVEGHELSVLLGAKTFLSQHQPIIVCEIGEINNIIPVFDFLEEIGYSGFFVRNKRLVKIDKNLKDWKEKLDYFFLPNDANHTIMKHITN